MNIIILNGPPNSGKDFIADKLIALTLENTKVAHLKFSAPIKSAVHNILNIATSGPNKLDIEILKDTERPEFYGKTPRQAYIEFSEEYMKPMYGTDIFGRLLLKKIEEKKSYGYKSIIISDGGFNDEVQVLLNSYPQLHIVKLFRKDCTFKNDSRDYVTVGENIHHYTNSNYDPDMFNAAMNNLFVPYLNGEGDHCFGNWLLNTNG